MHPNNSWHDVVVDALIAGAAAGVAVAATSPVPTPQIAYASLIAFLGAFVASLAAARKRGHAGR